ncbi:hypothetical protein FACS189497_15490 [Betaproteobacteria bacterium]|nr:hypothetical protein FACS189497_15490 [Betaproteobacteria bacterium]
MMLLHSLLGGLADLAKPLSYVVDIWQLVSVKFHKGDFAQSTISQK